MWTTTDNFSAPPEEDYEESNIGNKVKPSMTSQPSITAALGELSKFVGQKSSQTRDFGTLQIKHRSKNK